MLVKKFALEDAYKTIMIDTIRSVKVIDDEDEAQIDEEGFKRSKSWLSKVRKTEDEKSKWNFCFELELSDRSLQLYSPFRKEREKWVHMLQLVCKMNEQLIHTSQMTPF